MHVHTFSVEAEIQKWVPRDLCLIQLAHHPFHYYYSHYHKLLRAERSQEEETDPHSQAFLLVLYLRFFNSPYEVLHDKKQVWNLYQSSVTLLPRPESLSPSHRQVKC